MGSAVAPWPQGVGAQVIAVVSRQEEVDALCSAAASMTREGNRIAALALLWAAVAIAPTDFTAHRRLAAALTSAGDHEGAAEEYARFIEFMLKQDNVRRAAGELLYARAFLGDMPQLRAAANYVVPLAEVARVLEGPVRTHVPLPMPSAPSATTWTDPADTRPTALLTSKKFVGSNRAHRRSRMRSWSARQIAPLALQDLLPIVVVVSLSAGAASILVATAGGLR